MKTASLDNPISLVGKYSLSGACLMSHVDVQKGNPGLVSEISTKVIGNVGCEWKTCSWGALCGTKVFSLPGVLLLVS